MRLVARRMPLVARRMHIVVAALLLVACTRHSHNSFVPPQFPDGADGLKAMWSDILDSAKRDDRERVHDLLATSLLDDAQMRRLFGPRADALLPRYKQLMGSLINRGAVEFCGNVYEHKYDAVDVLPDDNGATVTSALVEPHALWAVRVRKSSETRGLRYDGWLYLDGKWKTVNQLGKFIDVVAPSSPGGK